MGKVMINNIIVSDSAYQGSLIRKNELTYEWADPLITNEDYKNDNEAYNAYQAGDYLGAIKIYQGLAVQNNHPVFYYNWAVSQHSYADLVKNKTTKIKLLLEAESIYKKAQILDPKYIKAYNNLGVLYSVLAKVENNKNYLTKANQQYDAAIKNDTLYGKAHYNLGILDFESDNFASAKRHFEIAINDKYVDDFSKVKSNYFLGVIYFKEKNYAMTISLLQKSLDGGLSNKFRKFEYYWREAHRLLNIVIPAMKTADKTLQVGDEHLDSLEKVAKKNSVIAIVKNDNTRPSEAIEFKKYTASELYQFGEKAYRQKKYSQAITFFNKALKTGYNKKDKDLWAMLGMSYSAVKEYRKGVSSLTCAINYGFRGDVIYLHRAALYYQTSESQKALADLAKCKVHDAYWHYWQAMASAELHDDSAAEEHFNEAIRLKPDFRSAYNGRGLFYWRQGRRELAEKDFDIAFPGRRK